MVLFGSEYEYEFPKTPAGIGKQVAGSKTEENLEGAAEGGLAEPLGEDSKRNFNALSVSAQASGGGVSGRYPGGSGGGRLPVSHGCDCGG